MRSTFGSRRYNFDWRSFITPGVKFLVLVCSGVFLLQTLADLLIGPKATSWIDHFFGLVPLGPIPALRIWQPVTYLFLHGGPFHLLLNMVILWVFWPDLELGWGKRRLLNYFLLCGVGAGLITIVVKILPMFWGLRPSDTPTTGASGAIFGILIANAILFPDRRIWLIPLPVTIPMRPYVAVMAAIEFFGTLGTGGDGVAHICHLGGMLVGYLSLPPGSFLYTVPHTPTAFKHQPNLQPLH